MSDSFMKTGQSVDRRLFLKGGAVLAAAIGIGGLELVSGAESASAATSSNVKIASFNVDSAWREVSTPGIPKWDQRVIGIARIISTSLPDVIGIQEAPNITIGTRTYYQADDICKLTSYAKVQFSNPAALLNPILYRSSQYTVAASGFKVFEDKPYPNYGKAMTWARFVGRSTGKTFYVFNTHFMPGADQQALRNSEAKMLAAEIKRINPGKTAQFVTGDFNAGASATAPQTKELAALGFKDSWSMTTSRMHGTFRTWNGYGGNIAGSRIDQIYAGGNGVKINYWENWTAYGNQIIGGKPPSDHNMIYTIANITQ